MSFREADDLTPAIDSFGWPGCSTEMAPSGVRPRLAAVLRTAPLLGLVAIGAVIIAGHPSIHCYLAASPPNEGLRVPSMSLETHLVDAETPVVYLLPIYNGSSQTIEIEDLTTNCAYVSLEPRSFQIAPTATQVVALTFNFAAVGKSDYDEQSQPFEISVVPEVKGVSHRLEGWNLPFEFVLQSADAPALVQRGELSQGREREVSYAVSENAR